MSPSFKYRTNITLTHTIWLGIVVLLGTICAVGEAESEQLKIIPTNSLNINFQPWGSGNNLSISPSVGNDSESEFTLKGKTLEQPAGFVTQDFNYRGSNVSVVIGNLSKSPTDAKISIGFDIKGLFRNYTLIFILGKSHINGWIGDTYYQGLEPHTINKINFADIVASHNGLYLMTERAVLTADRRTSINDINFGIQLHPVKAN